MNLIADMIPSSKISPSTHSSRSANVIKGLYNNETRDTSNMEESEISGYDEVSEIHMDLHDADYQPIDVQYLDTEEGLLCITNAITPLGFNCYVVSHSERHKTPTLEHISSFLNEDYRNSIMLKCGHKASGSAIRFAGKINFNLEDKSYNFRSNYDHPSMEEITPIITSTQLIQYPEESLAIMHDQYRSIRSDQVIQSAKRMDKVMSLISDMSKRYSQATDDAYDSLITLKESIDLLTSKPLTKIRNSDLSELITYRELILCKLLSIARKEILVSELASDYDELYQLIRVLE